jgi:hypothetical protein
MVRTSAGSDRGVGGTQEPVFTMEEQAALLR